MAQLKDFLKYRPVVDAETTDFIILGSGASLNHFNPNYEFFMNKFVIGINMIFKHFHCDFLVLHHHELLDKVILKNKDDRSIFVSRFHRCISDDLNNSIPEYYENKFTVYDHAPQSYLNNLDFSFQDYKNTLVTGGTTAIAAISLAVKLGAKNIFLCGIDGGSLDGETNLRGYYQAENSGNKPVQHNHSVKTSDLIIQFRDYLKTRGVNIFSINPFVNMNFEGHKFNL